MIIYICTYIGISEEFIFYQRRASFDTVISLIYLCVGTQRKFVVYYSTVICTIQYTKEIIFFNFFGFCLFSSQICIQKRIVWLSYEIAVKAVFPRKLPPRKLRYRGYFRITRPLFSTPQAPLSLGGSPLKIVSQIQKV